MTGLVAFATDDPANIPPHQAVFEAIDAPLALLVVRKGRVFFGAINNTFTRMTGVSVADSRDREVTAVLRGGVGVALAAAARQAMVRNTPLRIQAELALHGGAHDVVLSVVEERDGGRLVLVDAERRRASRLPGERGHSLAFDRLSRVNEGLIFIYDVQRQKSVYVAQPLAEMLGRDRTLPVQLANVQALIHPDDREAFDDYVQAFAEMTDSDVTTLSFRLPMGQGEWRWLSVRVRVLSRNRRGRVRRVLGVATDVTERRAMADALGAASQTLLDASEVERRRVGRELHDSTGQHLVAIDLGLDLLRRQMSAPEAEAERIMRDLRISITAAQREIRAFSYLLHPPLLRRRGLVETLRRFVEGFERRTALVFDLRLPARAPTLDDDIQVMLFRIAQEALMNVHRHADARQVRLELAIGPEAVILEVEDDGVGLTEGIAPGVGITGMQARLAQVGGRLTLGAGAKGGACLRAYVPLHSI